jgi:hypothetical protein
MNFSSKDSFLYMANKSLMYVKHHYGKENIYIYTDKSGENFVKENFDVNVEIVNFDIFRPAYWNYPKIVTFSLQTSPFIHLDFDFHLYKKPLDDILMSDIITEKRRARVIPKSHCPFVRDDIWESTTELICSGLVGGNNIKVFKELKKYADLVVNKYDHIINFNSLIGIEEVYLTYLCNINNLSIRSLEPDSYKHYQSIYFK